MRMGLLQAAVLLSLSAVLPGCSGGDDGDGAAATGSASVYVKDAPRDDFEEIHVVFTKVEVHRSAAGATASGTTTTADTDTGTQTGTSTTGTTTTATTTSGTTTSATGSDTATTTTSGQAHSREMQEGLASQHNAEGQRNTGSGAGWITVFESTEGVDVDLLEASGDNAAFLGEADLDAGRYQQIRVTVQRAYGWNGTQMVEFALPSGELRVVRSFEVPAGEEARIVLDFDLDRSLHQQGNGQWRMSPVVGRVLVDNVDDAASGEDADQPGDVGEV